MSDALIVNFQNPPRTVTLKPRRRTFDHATGYEIIAAAVLVHIFIKGCQDKPLS